MKLKELNDELEKVVDETLRELSRLYSKQTGLEFLFEFWSDTRHVDLDGNKTFNAVLDVRQIQNEKVVSFKRLYDRMLIQQPNEGTVDKPKYGKQLNVEELRKTVLRELLGKAIGGFALGMAARTKEQIQELYQDIPEEEFEELEITKEDIEDFNKENPEA